MSCTSSQTEEPENEVNLLTSRAFTFTKNGQSDSAFFYFLKARDLALQKKDSLNVGYCLLQLAILSSDKRDDLTAQDFSLEALHYLNEKKRKHHLYIASNYNSLGIVTQNLRDYENAIKFYNLAIKFSTTNLDRNQYLNNKAYIFQETAQYDKALKIYNLVLEATSKNENERARTLANISFTKWLLDKKFNPLPELLEALYVRKRKNDLWGQNASYSYLADYYAERNPDSALHYALKMYGVAKKIKSGDDQLFALQKLIKFSPGRQRRQYFETYLKLDDSAQVVRNKDKKQFALIRYETEKYKADNLLLQRDNTEKKYQLIKQKTFLLVGLTFAFFVIILSVILYKKRKQRLELASKNAIRENQLRTSKKVHDVVANGLYRVMTEIENSEDIDKNQVLDKLENMYEKSRDLSYEELHFSDENFHEKIGALLKSFAGENTKIVIVGNSLEIWKAVSAPIKYEIEHILQELMVNMKKHSGASSVVVRFMIDANNIFHIYYADNGNGMSSEQQFNNGLTSTGNRIVAIDGEIIFDTKVEKGLKIQISFPIS
ncbi:MAG: tetratricopeptide repeat-containing sensor histidine kinase [Pedobacter sp.]|nr:MAG: tetratricopeptide repeat-containing sensor histidine kinase [Pedobacter sp.]